MHGIDLFCFFPVVLSPIDGHSLIQTEMQMERSVELISPISVSKYTGSSGPTDDKIDPISSLCAWLSG